MSTTTSGNLHLTKPAYGEKADVAVFNTNMDTIDAGVTAVQNSLASKATKISLISSDNTWSKIWAKINTLTTYEPTPFYSNNTPFNLWSGGARNNSIVGTITRISSTAFWIVGRAGGASDNNVIAMTFTDVNSSEAGTYAEEIMAFDENVQYQEGQTLSMSSYSGYGFVTSSTKALYCYIPVRCLLPSGSFTLNTLTLTARGPSGYVDNISSKKFVENGQIVDANFTVTSCTRGNGGRTLAIALTKATALDNAVNNMTVTYTATISVTLTAPSS